MANKTDGSIIYEIRSDDSNLEKDLVEANKKVKKAIEDSADDAVEIEQKKNEKIKKDAKKTADNISESAKESGEAWEESAKTAEKAVESLGDAVDGVQGKEIEIKADSSQAKQEIENLQADDISINVDADTGKAEGKIDSVIRDETVDISVDADTSKAESRIKQVADDKSIRVKVGADTSDAEEAIEDLEKVAEDSAGNIATLIGNAFGMAKGSAGDALASVSPLVGKAGELAAGLSGTAVAAIGAGAAAAGVGILAGNVANDMDKAMNQFAASTGKSKEETERYQEVLENIYKNNYGDSFMDIADSMSAITKNMGDMDDEHLQKVSEAAFTLRDTFGYEIEETTRAAKAMMDNFGISGEDAMNMIAEGAKNGLDYSGELLDSISEYSVQFSKIGMDADDMFSVFQKGADSGAFNLDKVGDAIKEFSIRAIDNSDTTADAFQKLGFAASDVSEPLSKAKEDAAKYSDKISDLKDKLELAKLKQSEFTDKTSESAKLSNAKSIEKYEEELHKAQEQLESTNNAIASMEEQIANGGPSVEDFASKFAQGGKTAEDAFQMLIEKLAQVKDPLEQNTIGTELFGTMWEDLGPEVVSALADIEKGAYSSSDAMKEMQDVKYDDVSSNLESLKRNLELMLEPLGEELLPLANEAIQIAIPIAEAIGQIIGAITPLVSTILDILIPVIKIILSVVTEVFSGIATDVEQKISRITDIFKNIIEFIKNVFTGNWKGAWENVVNIFGDILGGIADLAKRPFNFVIDCLNGFFRGLNSIEIPDWVPVVGGKGFHLPEIPRLKVGLDYVPSDYFPAYLDEGEAVLTKQENALYRQLGGLQGMYYLKGMPDYPTPPALEIDYDRISEIVGEKDNGDIVLMLNGDEFMRWIRSENDAYKISHGGEGMFD